MGAISYFTYSKFKQEVLEAKATPSPSPQVLNFNINKTPTPAPQPSDLPLAKNNERILLRNKKLAQFPGIVSLADLQNKKAIIQTKKGLIELEVYPEATMAASNFLILAANGFYDELTFHRVEDWVVQGGDPTGTGSGGPGYQFRDEPVNRPYLKGVVAMANAGPDTNGSQFFILKQDYPLPPKYTIFGQVISGIDIVSQIAVGDVMQKVVIQPLK